MLLVGGIGESVVESIVVAFSDEMLSVFRCSAASTLFVGDTSSIATKSSSFMSSSHISSSHISFCKACAFSDGAPSASTIVGCSEFSTCECPIAVKLFSLLRIFSSLPLLVGKSSFSSSCRINGSPTVLLQFAIGFSVEHCKSPCSKPPKLSTATSSAVLLLPVELFDTLFVPSSTEPPPSISVCR